MLIPRAACLTGLIWPLYIAPGDSCSQWQPIIDQVAAHPNMPFVFIVNPASGPGTGLPDSTYQTCIPELRPAANPNTQVIGYATTGTPVATTPRAQADIESDITAYANWGIAYRPDGIFFDQIANNASDLQLYTNVANFARGQTWARTSSYITFNPGGDAPASFYALADLVVSFENFYDDFSNSDLTLTDSSRPPSKQAVILHTTPSTLPAATVSTLVSDQIHAIYLTDIPDNSTTGNNPYDAFPNYLSQLVSTLGSDESC